MPSRDVRERRCTHLPHDHRELGIQHLEDFLDASLPEGAESPGVGPPDGDGVRAELERLEDIRAAAQAAVEDNGHASVNGNNNLRQAASRPLASARPPWFETQTASTPWRRQASASSAVTMPLTITCIDVSSCSRAT